jgi:hypothetical protein
VEVTIQELGSIGELLAALATLGTLVYLARQVRQNTVSVQSANFGTWIDAINDANAALIKIADFAEDAFAATRPLTPSESFKFGAYCAQVLNAGEAVFLFHRDGTIDTPYFEAKVQSVLGAIGTPGGRECWESFGRQSVDSRFSAYLDAELARDPIPSWAASPRIATHDDAADSA